MIKGITVFALIFTIALGTKSAAAAAYRLYDTTYWFGDRAHGYDQYITMTSDGDIDTGTIYNVYWNGSFAHWPNEITGGNTWTSKVGTTGYARGTFKAVSGIFSEWTDFLQFGSFTDTITHTYSWSVVNPRNLYY